MSLDGMLGIRSLVGRPNRHMAGDIWVSGLGLFLYTRRALWNDDITRASVSCYEPFNCLHPRLSPIVGVGEVGRGDSVGDAPAG